MFSKWWEERKSKSLEKKITKYAVKICHINTTHEAREQIIYELSQIPGVNAVAALVNRFNLTLHDNPIKDESEKEKVAKEIVRRGDISIEPVKKYIKGAQEVSWPFDILRDLVSEEEFVKFAIEILTTEEALFDDRVIEKRLDVMKVLMPYKSSEIYKKVLKLVDDDDDRVKILALNILANQENIDEVREKLLAMMVDHETPPRLVRSIIDIFVAKEWKLTGYKNKVDSLLPHEEYFINKDGIIRKRQMER